MPRSLSLGLGVLTLTGLYLLGPARAAMNAWVAGIVLLHILLGLALIVPIAFVLRRVWSADRGLASGAAIRPNRVRLGRMAFAFLGILCAATGLTLFLRAAFGQSTARDTLVFWLHILSGVLGIGCWVLGTWRYRTQRESQGPELPRLRTPRTQQPAPHSQHLTSFLLLLMLTSTGALWTTGSQLEYVQDDYYRDLTATNALQANNPRFPAGTRFVDSAENPKSDGWRSPPATYCGRSGCHETAYREWQTSAHAFAASDPIYQRVQQEEGARTGPDNVRWCAGCHGPIQEIEERKSGNRETRKLGNEAISQSPNLPISSAGGVDCATCHTASGAVKRTGNGRLTLREPQRYPFAESQEGWRRWLHDFLLHVRPGPHQQDYHQPEIHRSPEFCASCHRQSFTPAQNQYQFVRGPDPYGEWQAGAFSGRTARTASLSPHQTRTCQQCHFPRSTSGAVGHACLGTNTTLSHLRGDTAHQRDTEAYLAAQRLSIDLFALRTIRPSDRMETWYAPLDTPITGSPPQPGQEVILEVVIANRNIGHSYPGGYEDIRDAWLEVRVADAGGRVLLQSGVLPSADAPLPPDTHAWRSVPLDRNGQVIRDHTMSRQVTTAYRRTAIPPSGAALVRYRFQLPKQDAAGKPLHGLLRLSARLRSRSLRPDFAHWALGEKSDVSRGEVSLPIITLAETEVLLQLNNRAQAPETNRTPNTQHPTSDSLARRFEDYGLALMAPKEGAELTRALRAFSQAITLTPNRPDPYLGAGRAYLAEPSLLEARTQFEVALRLDPDNAAARADLGLVFSKQGEYDRALRLLRPLAQQFPQDVALHFDLGLTLTHVGRYEEAATAFRQALATDPDYAPAHYQLTLCYQRLQRVPEARREEAISRYLSEDKLAARLRPLYRSQHPEDRNAVQPIPEHALRQPASQAVTSPP